MKTLLRKGLLGGLAAAIFSLTTAAFAADVPQTLTHQGRLYDASGAAVTGAKDLVFSVYDAADASTPIWSEKISVTFDEGYFSTNLGETSPLKDVFDGSVRYLGIQVAADPEMSPRVAINSVPYALIAGNVLGDITPASISIGGAPVIDAGGKWVGDPTGLMGPQGPAGADGLMGPAGADGAVGPMGPQGLQGDVGPMGPMGIAGPMGPQGPAGAIGPMGPAGATGATGPAGAQGPAGPTGGTGIVATVNISGYAGASIATTNPLAYVFVGPAATVATTATQRLTGAAEAPLGLVAASPNQLALVGLCYQLNAGGTITNFVGGNYSVQRFGPQRENYSAVGTALPGAGTWKVGFCVENLGTVAITDNDYVNGWVQVTN